MSYVLDALRRAESERQHSLAGHLLTAAQAPCSPAPVADPPDSNRTQLIRGLVIGMGLALLVIAALIWNPGQRIHRPTDLAQPTATPPRLPMGSSDATAAAAVMATPAPPPGIAEAAALPTEALASAPGRERWPSISVNIPSATSALTPPAGPLLQPQPTPIERTTPPLADAPPPTSEPRPTLIVSGVTYSERADHRMLIVNGQVAQEGQEVAPGHRLEAIGPRSAVIQHGAVRYNVNY